MRITRPLLAAAATTLSFVAVVACSGGNATTIGDGGLVQAPEAGGEGGSSSGGPDDGGVEGSTSACTPNAPPGSAVSALTIKFESMKTGSQTDRNAWKTRGYDRDGLCTTKTSTDVCKRIAGAAATVQEDGDDGNDNSWGHSILPLLSTFSSVEGSGYIATNGAGSGKLLLTLQGVTIEVPIVLAKVDVKGTTATFSALIPVEAFIASFDKSAGRFSVQLCGGSTIESINASLHQAADTLQTGSQSPSTTCDAISIGAELTGVANGTAPVIEPSPDPCGGG